MNSDTMNTIDKCLNAVIAVLSFVLAALSLINAVSAIREKGCQAVRNGFLWLSASILWFCGGVAGLMDAGILEIEVGGDWEDEDF